MNKLPVFYHIPKNAGTYVYSRLLMSFRHYRRKYTDWNKKAITGKDSIKSVQVIQDGNIVARLLVGDPNYLLENCPLFLKRSNTDWDIQLKDFSKELIQNVFLFGVVLESRGFTIRQKILNFVSDFDLHEFLILRDPFSRAQSIYNYNVSEESVHDYCHGAIESKNFEEYVISSKLEDSWLIRAFLNLKDSEAINQTHLESVQQILSSFYVYSITETDKAVCEAIDVCYGIDINEIDLRPWDKITKNETKFKKMLLSELSLQAQEVFKVRTLFDQKLYDIYVRPKQKIHFHSSN
jgi:hypothetical protein